jgi:NDP-sugar pyrophosphorylase family protein
MRDILSGELTCFREFEGRISDDATIWIQGTSVESQKRKDKILRKVRKGVIKLEGSVLIGRHCKIGDGVNIADSCIANYTKIGRNTTVEGSAIMDRVIVGEVAEIQDSIIGRHSTIDSRMKKPTKIESVSVTADDVILEAGCKLSATKIYPHLSLHSNDYSGMTIKRIKST